MQKRLEAKPVGQLTTDCKTFECSDIERLKKDICSSLHCTPHVTYGADRAGNTITQWRQTYTFDMQHSWSRGAVEIQFLARPTLHPSERSLTINTSFYGRSYWEENQPLYNQLKNVMKLNGFSFVDESVSFKELTKEEREKICKELEKKFCSMVDGFAEKCGEKVLKPSKFPEVTYELTNLKMQIRKLADSAQVDRKELIAHMQEKAGFLSEIFSDNPLLEKRIDSIILSHPFELGIADDQKMISEYGGIRMLRDVKNYLSNYSIIMDALQGDPEKRESQARLFKFVARPWNKES